MRPFVVLVVLLCLLFRPVSGQSGTMSEAMKVYSEGDYQRAVTLFEKARKEDSLNITAMRYLAFSLQNLDRHMRASEILSEAVRHAPRDIPMRLALARSYELTGQPEAAGTHYREAYAIDNTGILALSRLAQFLFEEHQWEEARGILRSQWRLDPDNSLVMLRLGVSEWNMGNTREAAAILQTALGKAQENAELVNQLSLLYIQMEMSESALKVLEVGLKFHERDARFHKRKADILFKQREFTAAATSYGRAIECGDSSAGTWRSLGAALFFLEKPDEALAKLRESEARDETEALTPYYLGLVWQKMGQADSSISAFEKAITLSRAKFISDALTHMSVSYEMKDSLAQSVASIKRAISLTPDNKSLLFYLASLYDRHYADRSIAMKYYEEFVRTAPDSEEGMVRQAISRLRMLREEHHFRAR